MGLKARRGTVVRVATLWLVLALAWRAEGASSEWVHPDPGGKLAYKTTPAGDIVPSSSANLAAKGAEAPAMPMCLRGPRVLP